MAKGETVKKEKKTKAKKKKKKKLSAEELAVLEQYQKESDWAEFVRSLSDDKDLVIRSREVEVTKEGIDGFKFEDPGAGEVLEELIAANAEQLMEEFGMVSEEFVKEKGYTDEQYKEMKKNLHDRLEQGQSVKMAMGMTLDEIDGLYQHGYSLYKAGQYDDAMQAFEFCITLYPTDYSYCFAYAASAHKLKKYDSAVTFYSFASSLDSTKPQPFYHAADCYMEMGDLAGAIVSLNFAIECGKMNEGFENLVNECELLKETLEKKLDEVNPRVEKGEAKNKAKKKK